VEWDGAQDLTRQNRDMKTVLQLKKLMYLDPVPRADLYNLTATKGLVSHRIRKKASVPPSPDPAQQASTARWSHPPGGKNPAGCEAKKTLCQQREIGCRPRAQRTGTTPRPNVQTHNSRAQHQQQQRKAAAELTDTG
jgi:hypothetical protein